MPADAPLVLLGVTPSDLLGPLGATQCTLGSSGRCPMRPWLLWALAYTTGQSRCLCVAMSESKPLWLRTKSSLYDICIEKEKGEKMISHHTLILFRKYTRRSPTAVPMRPAVPLGDPGAVPS